MKRSIIILTLASLFLTPLAYAQIVWNQISQPGMNLNIADEYTSYAFYNEKVGSHGSKYVLNKSSDGGHTYSMIKTKTGDMGCYSMEETFFIDADTGFYSEVCQGMASIYLTTDGGASWTNTLMGGSYGISMFFLRADYGYYTFYPGAPNDSYLMRNGSPVFITKKYVFAHNNYQYPGQKTEIFFRNDSTGLIMCKDSLDHAVIIKTVNYGLNWTEKISLSGEQFNDIDFYSDSLGFLVGNNGILYETNDFGESWDLINTNLTEDLHSIDFADDGVGYIAGSSGTILKSTDLGDSWEIINFINSNDLVYTRVFDDDHAFVLAGDGKLYSNHSGTGTEERWLDGISIYPNPASEALNILFDDKNPVSEVNIYDMQGRKLISSKQSYIDISSCNNGIYIIEFVTEKAAYKEIFVKH